MLSSHRRMHQWHSARFGWARRHLGPHLLFSVERFTGLQLGASPQPFLLPDRTWPLASRRPATPATSATLFSRPLQATRPVRPSPKGCHSLARTSSTNAFGSVTCPPPAFRHTKESCAPTLPNLPDTLHTTTSDSIPPCRALTVRPMHGQQERNGRPLHVPRPRPPNSSAHQRPAATSACHSKRTMPAHTGQNSTCIGTPAH